MDWPSALAVTLPGEFSLAGELAGVVNPDIHAQAGHECICTLESATPKGDDQGHAGHFPDSPDGLAILDQVFALCLEQLDECIEP